LGGGRQIYLSNADLTKAYLAGTKLSGADKGEVVGCE